MGDSQKIGRRIRSYVEIHIYVAVYQYSLHWSMGENIGFNTKYDYRDLFSERGSSPLSEVCYMGVPPKEP